MTNIDDDDCTATAVWGVEGGNWISFDVTSGAGLLGTYGMDEGQAYVITHEDCVCTNWEITLPPLPTPTPTPTPTPDTIHIDANAFLFCYPGITCDLPDGLTNIGPAGLDIVTTVWGTVDGQWVSYDAEIGAGNLRELVNGKPYIMTHGDGVCNDWEMPQ